MTIIYRLASELPSSYVDPLAERRENLCKNTPEAEAYNERSRGFDPTPQTGDNRVIHTSKDK